MAQGYAFGRPAPLPSPAAVFIGEMTDTPAEDVAGELLQEPIAPPAVPLPRPPAAPNDADTDTHYGVRYAEDDDTGYLTGELALTNDLLEEIGEDPDAD
jgi:hypothetical protein